MSEKVRGKNYTEREKRSLLECIKPHKNIIEWPITDKKSNEKKAMAWNEIAKSYNARNSVHRDTKSLVGLYKHMKCVARKKNIGVDIKHFKREDEYVSDTAMSSEEKPFDYGQMPIDDSLTIKDDFVEDLQLPGEDGMSYKNSNDVVRDYIESNNFLPLDEKSELEIELLKVRKALTMKHLEIAEVELQIKKTMLEKERKALEQMSQT